MYINICLYVYIYICINIYMYIYIYIFIYIHAHISLQRLVEMLVLQCAQRFPARPAEPDSSVFAELFPAPQLAPSQPNVPPAKARQMHLNWNPLGFCWNILSKSLELVAHQTFGRLFSAGVSERPSPRGLPTLTVARFAPVRCASILWVIMSSLASSTQVLFAVTTISWMWWHPCRVTPRSVLCVSITRCGQRVVALASRVTLKSLTSLSLSEMVLSLMLLLCVSSRVAAVHLGGGTTVCAILITSYRPVPRSRSTSTRTAMGSSQGICTCHRRDVLSDPR